MINLNDFSENQIRSLARFKQIGGDTVLNILGLLVEEGKNSLVRADETVRIHRLQGRVEAFQDLLAAIEDAAELDSRKG